MKEKMRETQGKTTISLFFLSFTPTPMHDAEGPLSCAYVSRG